MSADDLRRWRAVFTAWGLPPSSLEGLVIDGDENDDDGCCGPVAGVSPRMLSLFLTGRVVDSLSEIDVDAEGLAPELVDSMPGQNTGMMGRSSRTAGARRGGSGGAGCAAPPVGR